MRSLSILRSNIYEGVITQFSSDLQNGVISLKSILCCDNDRDLLVIKRGTHCSKESSSSELKHQTSVSFDVSQIAFLAEGDVSMSKEFPTDKITLYLPVGLPVLVDAHESDHVSQSESITNVGSQQPPIIESSTLVSAVYVHKRNMGKTPVSCCPYGDIFSSPYFSLSASKATPDILIKWYLLDTHEWARWHQYAYAFNIKQQSHKDEAVRKMLKFIPSTTRSSDGHISDIDAVPFD
ncbi:unnamed protein product [Phytomonas sp. Hart1]|nr:unnamed protein product [Phytomonas sp. Hart1]|eukprot:CCW68723.1 unnamed protein product [Phytomonas sp. isolate Hart1]